MSEKQEAIGNTALLRDALGKSLRILRDTPCEPHTKERHEIIVLLSDALSAPPRNCDKFKTPEEAEKEFVRFCGLASMSKIPWWKCPPDCGHTGPDGWVSCCVRWLLSPATPENGGAA